MKLTHALAAVGIAAATAFAAPSTPAQAASAANVGINHCEIGPSSAGECLVVFTQPGTYILSIDSDADSATAELFCHKQVSHQSVTATGDSTRTKNVTISEQDVCHLVLTAVGGSGTAIV